MAFHLRALVRRRANPRSELIDAYCGAISELREANSEFGRDPYRIFSRQEIENLVLDYRQSKMANIRPAMMRYLQLLESGNQAPA